MQQPKTPTTIERREMGKSGHQGTMGQGRRGMRRSRRRKTMRLGLRRREDSDMSRRSGTRMAATTNNKKPNHLALGEPSNHTKLKLVPHREPPAWKWIKTPRPRALHQAHPSTTASRRPRPEATTQRTPPGALARKTTSSPSTRSLKKRTMPASTPTSNHQHTRTSRTETWELRRHWQRPKLMQ